MHISEYLKKSGFGAGKKLAAAIGVSQPTVSYWNRGASTPSPDKQTAINALAGMRLEYGAKKVYEVTRLDAAGELAPDSNTVAATTV